MVKLSYKILFSLIALTFVLSLPSTMLNGFSQSLQIPDFKSQPTEDTTADTPASIQSSVNVPEYSP